ncbi:MAG: hypothetical protein DRI48_09700 [Chloroflexi bacterium]|nr:MAG: hypothetical protein DRI48_09700 [Chloroflexota bacterium]
MPADLLSAVVLIILTAADGVKRLWPYVLGGVAVAASLSYLLRDRRWAVPARLPRSLAVPLAAALGVVSPLPTLGTVPILLRLHSGGLPGAAALAFALASSLLNPQLLVLTLGAMGPAFVLVQLASVLALSTGIGLWLGNRISNSEASIASSPVSCSPGLLKEFVALLEHVGLYFLLGVIAGAALQVLLPYLGVLGWLDRRGWLSVPLLGWLGAPFYTCGGSAVPLASGLVRTGFSPGTMFTFLLVGPATRGTTLATLGCLLPGRARTVCLVALFLAGGLLGYGLDLLIF